MGQDAALDAVRQFRLGLARRGVSAERVIVFGSYARGTARQDSDIDVVVISNDFAGRDLWERIQLMTPAISEVHAPIEAIAMTPQEWAAGDSPVVEFASDGMEV